MKFFDVRAISNDFFLQNSSNWSTKLLGAWIQFPNGSWLSGMWLSMNSRSACMIFHPLPLATRASADVSEWSFSKSSKFQKKICIRFIIFAMVAIWRNFGKKFRARVTWKAISHTRTPLMNRYGMKISSFCGLNIPQKLAHGKKPCLPWAYGPWEPRVFARGLI